MKKCTKCNKEKRLNQFHVSQIFKDKHNNWCKDCMKKYHKIYASSEKGKLIIYLNIKNWTNKNREKARLKSNKWKKHNRKKINKYRKEYDTKKRKTDMNFRIEQNLRSRIRMAIKNKVKFTSTKNLIGCSIEFLRKYLQNKFTKGMNWSNCGKWHVDHIKPCCKFNLTKESEQLKCFHYKNLQPLWAKDNLIKGAKCLKN